MPPTTANLDWLYALLGSLLIAAALLMLAWALLWDRARGRRRCPKCWYDMGGTPGLRCPECGKTAKGEWRLSKTRRRWVRAIVALTILAAGVGAASFPAYQHGWVRLVPTALLAYCAPADDPEAMAVRSIRSGTTAMPRSVSPGTIPGLPQGIPWQILAAPPPPSLSAQLTIEFWRRLGDHRVSPWLARRFLDRYFRRIAFDFSSIIDLPDHWPVGEPVVAQVRREPLPASAGVPNVFVRLAAGATWVAAQTRGFLDPINAPTEAINVVVELRFGDAVLYTTNVAVPCSIRGDVSTFLDRVDDAETTRRVQRALAPELVWLHGGDAVVRVRDRSSAAPWPSIDFGVAFQVDVRRGDQVLGTGAGISEWKRPVWKDWEEIPLVWEPGGRDVAMGTGDRLTLLVRGDPAAAGKSYVRYPFGRTTECWTGSFEVPAGPR